MPRRPTTVTQADIARAIRAVRNAGLPVVRVIVRSDGVAVETVGGPDIAAHAEGITAPPDDAPRRIVL